MRLSIVCVTRNDDYGFRMLDRFAAFLKCIPSNKELELIIVEWNPLDDRERMIDIVKRMELGYLVRVVTVPNLVHRCGSFAFPVVEYWGKNVGLSYARGDWVLFLNPDLIIPERIFEGIFKGSLNASAYYRAVRVDVKPEVLDMEGDVFENCKQNVVKVNRREDAPFSNASGDFLLMSTDVARQMRGYIQTEKIYTWLDTEFVERCYSKLGNLAIFDTPIYHVEHGRHDRKVNQYIMEQARKDFKHNNGIIGLDKTWLEVASNME